MGKPEKKVEDHLIKRVEKDLNGFVRKCVFPGRRGALDRIAFIPQVGAVFIEVKTTSGELSKLQVREMKRMIEVGCHVVVLSGKREVDAFIESVKTQLKPTNTH